MREKVYDVFHILGKWEIITTESLFSHEPSFLEKDASRRFLWFEENSWKDKVVILSECLCFMSLAVSQTQWLNPVKSMLLSPCRQAPTRPQPLLGRVQEVSFSSPDPNWKSQLLFLFPLSKEVCVYREMREWQMEFTFSFLWAISSSILELANYSSVMSCC